MSNTLPVEGSGTANAGVQSVERAVKILTVLARNGGAGVTELARELGVHKSTAFRLVTTLEHGGLVEQTDIRGRYHLGMGILRLASATTARLNVVAEARPICRNLSLATGETVNIAVLSERSALYLDQFAGASALQPHNWVGQHIPLHATSNGKVLLSSLAEDELDLMLASLPLPKYTDKTITDETQLRHELGIVRRQGFAVAIDEMEVGLSALATPIQNAHGETVASLSLSGPTFRLSESRIMEALPRLTSAGEEISTRLGWVAR
jgi:DNA-binding IclR family transcriptional regulator